MVEGVKCMKMLRVMRDWLKYLVEHVFFILTPKILNQHFFFRQNHIQSFYFGIACDQGVLFHLRIFFDAVLFRFTLITLTSVFR